MTESHVVIVGAGSAGCVLAARLSEDSGRHVTLVEAGIDYDDASMPEVVRSDYGRAAMNSPYNWSYPGRMTARQGRVEVSRGKLVGGSGAINGSMFLPGLPEDYDGWGMPGWSSEHMTRAHARIAEPVPVMRHPAATWLPFPAAFERAAREEGFPAKPDIGNPAASGIGAVPLNSTGGRRTPASVTHLDPVRHRPNLDVLDASQARRILLEDRRVTGVELQTAEGIRTLRCDELVLCSSGVGSAHLLLVSGIGPAEELRDAGVPTVVDLPGVGRNLKDHPVAALDWRPGSVRPAPDDPRFQVLLQYTSPGCPDRNDMQFIPTSVATAEGDPMAGQPVRHEAFRIVACMQLLRGAGAVRLQSSDPLEPPLVDYCYLEHADDRRRLRAAVRLAVRLVESASVGDVVGERLAPGVEVDLDDDDALDEWLYRSLGSAQHSSGTCRMGSARDLFAVVDEQCRVRSVDGLRIADLSIAPDVVRAPTNAAAMAIADRAADLWLGS